jgi:hypothetical protein
MLLKELAKQEFADMLKGKYSDQGLIDLFIYLDEESQETGEDIVIGKAPYTVKEITSAFFEWESVDHYNSVKGTNIKSHFDLDYDKDVFVFLAPTNDDDTVFWTME